MRQKSVKSLEQDLNLPRQEIYRTLCDLLAGRHSLVDWAALRAADWALFLEVARQEGVAPLAYWHFKEADWPAAVPEGVRAALADTFHETAVRNMVRFRELDRILWALQEAGVPVILLKGAALATTVYPNVALRPMGDLDLLVPMASIDPALDAIRPLGYSESKSPVISRRRAVVGKHHWPLFHNTHRHVVLELHWALIKGVEDLRSPPLDWFWEQTTPYRPPANGATPVPRYDPVPWLLTPTAHLLYLAAHVMLQHGGRSARLIWYYDLHLLLSKRQVKWNSLLAHTRELGWDAVLEAALKTVGSCFGTPVPDSVMDGVAQSPDERVGRLVSAKGNAPPRTRTDYSLGSLAVLSWKGRLVYVWDVLMPTRSIIEKVYSPQPAWLWPLYYPFRWLDIVRDVLSTIVTPDQEAEKGGSP